MRFWRVSGRSRWGRGALLAGQKPLPPREVRCACSILCWPAVASLNMGSRPERPWHILWHGPWRLPHRLLRDQCLWPPAEGFTPQHPYSLSYLRCLIEQAQQMQTAKSRVQWGWVGCVQLCFAVCTQVTTLWYISCGQQGLCCSHHSHVMLQCTPLPRILSSQPMLPTLCWNTSFLHCPVWPLVGLLPVQHCLQAAHSAAGGWPALSLSFQRLTSSWWRGRRYCLKHSSCFICSPWCVAMVALQAQSCTVLQYGNATYLFCLEEPLPTHDQVSRGSSMRIAARSRHPASSGSGTLP